MACTTVHGYKASDYGHGAFRLRAAKACACAGALVLACASACALALACFAGTGVAWAEDIETDPQADELQQEVERTAAAYEDAVAQVDEANKALDENRARIAELEAVIPAQQERSDIAARELYKIEQQGSGILELLLSSEDFHSFVTNLEYATRASEANVSEIHRLAELKTDLDDTQDKLRQAKADADEHAKEAESALAAAKEARQEAQRRAQEEARRQAEAAAAAAAAAAAEEQAKAEAAKKSEDEEQKDETASKDEKDSDADSSTDKDDAAENESEETPIEPPSNDNADWTSDQQSFVDEWAPRIDSYLDGSPLGGQGKTFAAAAWTYGVDPRWSPAISFTESSKGADCFKPHNAWGWGSESWGTWEEAIDAHVRGLARGYGYTISVEAAQKYCPPNWQTWYNRTLEQMNMI